MRIVAGAAGIWLQQAQVQTRFIVPVGTRSFVDQQLFCMHGLS